MADLKCISFNPVLDVNGWDQAEEMPTGSREKLTLIGLKSDKHHIFKLPKQHREHQLWSELLASFIAGDLLGWDVQKTAIAEREGRLGNLLEYIYEPGSRDVAQEIFLEGWVLCKQTDPNYDEYKGTRHTLPLLLQVWEEILAPEYDIAREDYFDFWSRAFALDTLISNTDRHAENWAIIKGPTGSQMAPLYDNGSSMGCGFDQIGLDKAFDDDGTIKQSHLDKQFANGRHHVRMDAPAKHGSSFEEVAFTFLGHYPEGRSFFEAAESINLDRVDELMATIGAASHINEPYDLSERRRQHIYSMLHIGRERIRNVLHRG